MNEIICLYGAPGSGKSTCAAAIYSKLKQQGLNVELVREYVKAWAWENRPVKPYDEAYISVKQARQEAVLLGKVDVIITDCPLYISAYYENKYSPNIPGVALSVIERHHYFCKEAGYTIKNLFLERTKAYIAQGRFQSEEESNIIAKEMKEFLTLHNVNYKVIPGEISTVLGNI